MDTWPRRPSGPRGIIGARAEDAAVRHLSALGWTILGRNERVGPDEIDIVALEPGDAMTLVLIEVRSRSGPRFGAATESLDRRKVARLYRAALALSRGAGTFTVPGPPRPPWRVDLLALRRRGDGWQVEAHVRGLTPP